MLAAARCIGIADLFVSWSRHFDEPTLLPDGRKPRTLAEAVAWLTKEVPKSEHKKSEHKMEKVQTAAYCVTRAAEHGGPMIFARWGCCRRSIGIVRASSIQIAKTRLGSAGARYVMAAYLPFI